MTAGHIVSRAEVLILHHGYTPSFDLGLKVAERVIDGSELRIVKFWNIDAKTAVGWACADFYFGWSHT